MPKAENVSIVVINQPKPYIYFEHIGPYFHVERTFRLFHSFPKTAGNYVLSFGRTILKSRQQMSLRAEPIFF